MSSVLLHTYLLELGLSQDKSGTTAQYRFPTWSHHLLPPMMHISKKINQEQGWDLNTAHLI